MKRVPFTSFIIIFGCTLILSQCTISRRSSTSAPSTDWVLVWNDEFNGANGSPPDPNKWVVVHGGHGWGNHELQDYTERSKNVRQENGNLVIEAFKEASTDPSGVRREYTSGRLKTAARFSQKYGRFEARIKIPTGQGMWPAFWLLGDDIMNSGWPACGEIDIMENVGQDTSRVFGTIHGPGYSGRQALSSNYVLPQGRFSQDFHVFSLEWEPQLVRFYVDGQLYSTRTPADLPPGKAWVFDHSFFVLLNLAVGGDLPGAPDDSTVFPQQMLVDYVRVYQRKQGRTE